MKKLLLLSAFLILLLPASLPAGAAETAPLAGMPAGGEAQRAYFVHVLTSIADPVLSALSQGKLRATMPAWSGRTDFQYLEAFGRLLAGMAPWLELPPDNTGEGKLRAHYLDLTLKSIHQAVDPKSPDFLNFNKGRQPLVDAAFLALGLLRAPRQIWEKMSPEDQKNMIVALKSTRVIPLPTGNNWTLFASTIEAALWKFDGTYDKTRLETGIGKTLQWYLGDGVYGDGPDFHFDYYNSYVIQPMLVQVLQVCGEKKDPTGANLALALTRAQRYAAIKEMLISPEGTYPVIGRSSTYRFGAFQHLADMALLHNLPKDLSPAAVRCGLTAVIYRTMSKPGPFDPAGWLVAGVIGSQPLIAESYISPGSPYLCSVGLLQLGLPATDPFWTLPDAEWTQKRVWAGDPDIHGDHFIRDAKPLTIPGMPHPASARAGESPGNGPASMRSANQHCLARLAWQTRQI